MTERDRPRKPSERTIQAVRGQYPPQFTSGDPLELSRDPGQFQVLAAVVEKMFHPLILTMEDGRITYPNASAEQLFGCTKKEMYLTSIFDRLRSPEGDRLNDTLGRQVAEGISLKDVPVRVLTSDGRRVSVLLCVTAIVLRDGVIVRAFGEFRDMTEIEQKNAELLAANAALQDAHRRMEEQARRDDLTGLYNRRALYKALGHEMMIARMQESDLSVVFCDPNRLKIVNDTCGHEAGDPLLCEIARLLQSTVQPNDFCARHGGDEFVVVLPRTNRSGLESCLKRLSKRLTFSYACKDEHGADHRFEMSAALGGAVLRPDMEDPKQLIKAADHAMYVCKRSRDTANRLSYYIAS